MVFTLNNKVLNDNDRMRFRSFTAVVLIRLFCVLSGDVLLKPIIECAGKDISHWFDPKTKDVSGFNTIGMTHMIKLQLHFHVFLNMRY